ncbi:MAG: hypothetical protein R3Y63_09315 [Eubacteriales bacterium]
MGVFFWSQVKKGYAFSSVHSSLQEEVKSLAKADVVEKVITEAEYKTYIGEKYTA